jgi:hypothetical protein
MSELMHTLEVLGGTVVQWSWQLAFFIGFLWLAVRLDRRHRPEFRYRLWTFALLVSLGLPWTLQGIASYSWTIRAREVWTDSGAFGAGHSDGRKRAVPQTVEMPRNVSSPDDPDTENTRRKAPSATIVYRAVGLLWVLGIAVGVTKKAVSIKGCRELWNARSLS